MDFFVRLISAALLVWHAFRAWRNNDRRGVIDAALIGVSMAALLIPETLPGVRYGIAGVALATVLARNVKRDLIDGSDKYARAMTIGLLVFAASVILTMSVPKPIPPWAKYLAISGAVVMLASLLWPFLWMTRLLFSAHRLAWDLKHSRPPREADEKTLGIDLSMPRQPPK